MYCILRNDYMALMSQFRLGSKTVIYVFVHCCLVLDVGRWLGGSDMSGVVGGTTFPSPGPPCCAHLHI